MACGSEALRTTSHKPQVTYVSQANVKSTDAIESVRAALLQFAKQCEEGLTEINLEMRRLMDWLEHDRPAFWKQQVHNAHDGVMQAKADLHRCLMFPVGMNDRPSCSEERAALKKAEAKLAYCQEKQEKLRHWIREISHELHTYEGRTAQLREVIEADAPAAATALHRLLLQIEAYTSLSSGGSAPSGAGTSPADAGEQDKQTNSSAPTPETPTPNPSPHEES